MSFLVVDIGNTRLKWGLYEHRAIDARLLAHGAVYLEQIETLAEREWSQLAPAPTAMLGCVVAGNAVRRRAEEQLDLWDLRPRWVVSEQAACGVTNGYEHPTRLGSDRWAAIIGAHGRVRDAGERRPAIVVMVGTAVTVEAIDADGHFLGGLILPGFGLMLKALESGTAGLHVPTGEVRYFPTNTSDALMSGGTYAIAGAIERMHRHVVQTCGAEPALFMTGGAAVKLAPITPLGFEVVDLLIFEGLLRIAQERG
ncbi:MAG TPA: type III pantothenate kinase [Burkholderiaceae bacterium]|nr:type III pantothenate kinase [Burkholderiaceae bacterium]HMX09493.1 type III pantothenate kinase [Burkholderiaceae bacterium]HNB42996.1 type III pantothenate kinase [Burkholderiaceae bacterium]HNG77852.1 type III pantothenate kinase [Burkholderiaceae bacterium]